MRRIVQSIALIVAVLATNFGTGFPTLAQTEATVDVYVRSIDLINGGQITDVCYIFEGASIEGCDENGDGLVEFQDVQTGTFTLIQTEGADGYHPVGAFPVTVAATGGPRYVTVKHAPSGEGPATVDIAISPVDVVAGESLAGACFLLYGGSIEGCDENGDGQVDFQDVPVGSYLMTQTQAPEGYQPLPDRWITADPGRSPEIRVLQVPASDPAWASGALTITALNCPFVMPGDEVDPTACTAPAAGLEFFIATPATDNVLFAAADENGTATFPLAPFAPGPGGAPTEVGQLLATNPGGEVTGYQVACTKEDGTTLTFDYQTGDVAPGGTTYGIRFNDYAEGDQIDCTWYNAIASTA